MWKRNLLFLGLVLGGAFTLGANLMPPREPRPATSYDASAYQAHDLRTAIAAVDQSFEKAWKDEKIQSAAPAPDLAVARRLSLGLMGTIPSLEEIRQFEWLPADERLPWWIDHILQDRRFADYLGERLARAFVGTENGPFIRYRRRRFVTWLSDQIAKKRPYDALVRDIITARGLWTNEPATNFISVTIKQESKNQPDPIRLGGKVARAFLGLRLECAECHNAEGYHPTATWTQADFQGLSAFFARTQIGFTGVYEKKDGEYVVKHRTTQEERTIAPAVPYAPELLPAEGNRRQQLAAWVTHPKNPYFSRAIVNRVWALVFGKPLIDPVDDLQPGEEQPPPEALQILSDDFVAHGFDIRRLIRIIASTRAFRLDSALEQLPDENDEAFTKRLTEGENAWAVFPLTRLRPEQVVGGVVQLSSVTTVDADSHLFVRLARIFNQTDFLRRYGDSGEDEFSGRGGTIPQRLLMMNGTLIRDRIQTGLFSATSRIANQSPNDHHAIETAYLTILTRRPTPEEAEHFEQMLRGTVTKRIFMGRDRKGGGGGKPGKGDNAKPDPEPTREQRFEDMFWALINSTEFSWNH